MFSSKLKRDFTVIERRCVSTTKSKMKVLNETCDENQSIKLSIRLMDILGESYSIKDECKVSLKLEKIKEKTENSFTIHKADLLGRLYNVEVYNTCSDVNFSKFKLFKTEFENEVIMELKTDKAGIYRMTVQLNNKILANDVFVEAKGSKKNGIEEEMTSTNQSISTKRTTFNKSRQSSSKRYKSNSKNGSNLFIRKDKKLIIKNGSIQPMKKKSLNLTENRKKPNLKDILMSKKGKLEKLLKGRGVVIKKKVS